jgi:glyoxylase-like metal-dependent hydrolase (beta-lactamase superfamily II)
MLNYRKLVVGELGTNCYLLWSNDKKAVIIDPGDEGVEIAQIVAELGLTPQLIVLTHGHFDHILGVLDLQLIFKIPVMMSDKDIFLLDRAVKTAEYYLKKKIETPKFKTKNIVDFKLSDEVIKIISTPGHTPGGVCLYSQKSGLLFTGDTLFETGIGDTSHQYSSKTDLTKSLEKIYKLKNVKTFLPGHGEEFSLT